MGTVASTTEPRCDCLQRNINRARERSFTLLLTLNSQWEAEDTQGGVGSERFHTRHGRARKGTEFSEHSERRGR